MNAFWILLLLLLKSRQITFNRLSVASQITMVQGSSNLWRYSYVHFFCWWSLSSFSYLKQSKHSWQETKEKKKVKEKNAKENKGKEKIAKERKVKEKKKK